MYKGHVLLVDDDANHLKTLSYVVEESGYKVWLAHSGKEALTFVNRLPDVAIVDLAMPELSGLDVIQGLMKHSPGTKCIILTAYASQENTIKALNLGAYGYLQKPVDVDKLLPMLASAVAGDAGIATLRELTRQLPETPYES